MMVVFVAVVVVVAAVVGYTVMRIFYKKHLHLGWVYLKLYNTHHISAEKTISKKKMMPCVKEIIIKLKK